MVLQSTLFHSHSFVCISMARGLNLGSLQGTSLHGNSNAILQRAPSGSSELTHLLSTPTLPVGQNISGLHNQYLCFTLMFWLCACSVTFDSMRPYELQPTRLLCPWDSPGKNTGVGCHCLLQCMKVKSESEVAQSCPTLSDPMNCSPPGSSVHGIFQAIVLEWDTTAFSKR